MEALKQLFSNIKQKPCAGPNDVMILEGRLLLERLYSHGHKALAILCVPELSDELKAFTQDSCPIISLTEPEIGALAGYKFHRGVLAAAEPLAIQSLHDWLTVSKEKGRFRRLLVCPRLSDPSNLGNIYRNAAGFGWEAIAIGKNCCSPFSRKALRVSMGAAFSLHTLLVDSPQDITALKKAGYLVIGTSLKNSSISLEELASYLSQLEVIQSCHQDIALVLGHEYDGLPDEWESACTTLVTIPMAKGHDSLNVALASGIFMYRLGQTP